MNRPALLRDAVAAAIARDLPRCHDQDGALDLNAVAEVAIAATILRVQGVVSVMPSLVAPDVSDGAFIERAALVELLSGLLAEEEARSG